MKMMMYKNIDCPFDIDIERKELAKDFKNPYINQYVAPLGYHFLKNGYNYGRIAWFSNVDGVTIEKDE